MQWKELNIVTSITPVIILITW